MKRLFYVSIGMLVALSMLLGACAKPAPSPTPTTAPTPKAPAAPTPQASPTPAAKAPAQTPRYGGTFKWVKRFGLTGSILPLQGAFDTGIYRPAFDALLRQDVNGDPVANLAADFKFAPDFKSLTLSLRKGVKFHDGSSLDAETAKWNLLTRKAARIGDYEDVTSIDVIDDYTIRLNLSRFRNNLLTSLYGTAGYMYSRSAYEKNGVDWAALNPVGTGAFKFVNYQVTVAAKYQRNDAYWQKGKPYLDAYEAHVINDAQTERLAFEKGDFDLVQDVGAKDVSELKTKGYSLMLPYWGSYALVADSTNADSPFSNKKVREALSYAIDGNSIAKALGYGLWEGVSQLARTTWAFYDASLSRPFDVAKAKQLLAEAGYPNGFKTTLYVTTPGDAEVATMTNLKAVGIEVTLSTVPTPRFNEISQNGWKNAILRPSFPIGEDTWHTAVYSRFSTTSIAFKSTQRPSGLQPLLEQIMEARDARTRFGLQKQANKIIFDEAMITPFILYGTGGAYRDHVKGVEWLTSGIEAVRTGSGILGPEDMWLSK